MASERDDCVDKIVRASGGKLSREEAMDALDEILQRAERKGPDHKPIDEKLAEAMAEMQDALIERASVMRRNEIMDGIKASGRHRFYDRAPSPQAGMEAKLVGVNASFTGHRRSADYAYRAKKREVMGGFVSELERDGLDRIFASRALEREWATELHELNKAEGRSRPSSTGYGGRPGITLSEDARKIAEAIKRWQTVSIDGINREGGWIKSYSGYITRTSHDPDKIGRAGGSRDDKKAAAHWADDVLARIDVARTFHDADPASARKILEEELWKRFATGDHYDYGKPLEDLDGLLKVDFARKASAPRELHFKSADAWLEYNKLYGMNDPTAQVMASFDRGAKSYALLKEFGSQPRLAFEEDLRYLKSKLQDRGTKAQIDEFEQWEAALRNRFAQLDGTALKPVNRTIARIGSDIRSVVRTSKLGLTPYAMLGDLATKTSELRYQGMTVPERYGTMLSGYFQGADGSEKRQVAELLLATVSARINDLAQRFDAGDTPHGWISRAETQFFRITGISAMTHNQRADAEVMMARHMGMQRGKPYDALGAAERRILKAFEIEKPEWELLHKTDWHDFPRAAGEVVTYLTPDVANKLKDADVHAYLVARGGLHRDAKGPMVEFAVTRAREDLAQKLWTYFVDRGEYAVLEPGGREKAILYGGDKSWAAGTIKGEAWRLFMQFKQFPALMMTKTWGRELHGGAGRSEQIAGLAEFIVYATTLGIVANALNQVTKGQDPISKWKNEPGSALMAGFIRGGVASIYGDFLLGEYSRHGIPASGTVLGPTFGQIDRVFEIHSDLTHMNARRATGALATRTVRDNLPFMNMIYTKAAFDYLIYFRIQESINPGYLERYERTMKQNQGIEFWLRPTQVSR